MTNLKDQYVGKIVVFNKSVDNIDSDFDVGMKARVLFIEDGYDDCWKVHLDFSDFNEYNKARAKATYWDKNYKPTLTWWETSYFPKNFKCEEYADPNDLHFDLCVEEVEKIYVVSGSSCDYDHSESWLVKAFKNKREADSFCSDVQKRANEILGKCPKYHHYDQHTNEFDPKMQFVGPAGADYSVEELELM